MALNEISFSAVIPCYNDDRRIGIAVQSCLNQSFPAKEIIIVDDGSNDHTRNVIAELAVSFGNRGVRAIHLNRNSGVATARNTGMASAIGTFVCFLDSDDSWHHEKLKKAHQALVDLGKVVLGTNVTYNAGDLSRRRDSVGKIKRVSTFQLLLKNPMMTSTWVVPNCGFKFRSDFRHTEDHEFLLRISRAIPIYYQDEKLVYRNRPINTSGGLSGDKWKMRKGEMKMYYHFCMTNWLLMPMLPIFIVYSLAKHVLKFVWNTLR